MRLFAATVASVFVCTLAGPAYAATYYVSADGSDANGGTSAASAWLTVAKVNVTALQPGDEVLFRGGEAFGDTYLNPRSGAAETPITYSSFGGGQATLTKGAWFSSGSYFVLDNLRIDRGPGWGGQGIASSSGGTGSRFVTIRRCTIVNVSLGIQPVRSDDANWLIEDNVIDNTGDSGILLHGHGHVVAGNTITNTGRDSAIAYGKHGIYSRSADVTIKDNVIRSFQSSGVSVRYRDSVVIGNRISGGALGISWFQYDVAGGNSKFIYNTISDVTSAGIYVNPSDPHGSGRTIESFVVAHNTIDVPSGAAMNVNTSADLIVANNIVTGTPTYSYQATLPGGNYAERNNLWFQTGRSPSFSWNGTVTDLDGYRSASDEGANDIVSEPQLDSAYRPTEGSPAVDRGSRSVWLLTYSAVCDGQWLDYCGSAPDLGAFEVVTEAPPEDNDVTVDITSPADGATVGSTTFAAAAEASDPSGIADLVFFLDGSQVCDAGGVESATCALTAAPGWHALQVEATNGGGESGSATIWVRINPPKSKMYVRGHGLRPGSLRRMALAVDGLIRCRDFRRPYVCSTTTETQARRFVVRFSARARRGHVAHLRARARNLPLSRVRFLAGKRVVCVDRSAPFGCSFWMAPGRRAISVVYIGVPAGERLFAARVRSRL